MTIKLKGSFGPITGAMNVGDKPISATTFVGLDWEMVNQGLLSGDFNATILSDTSLELTSTIATSSTSTIYSIGFVSEEITGDFTFSMQESVPNNQGLLSLDVLDSNGDLIYNGDLQQYLIESASYAAYNSGNAFTRSGYTSYHYGGSNPRPGTLSITRTGSNIQGIGDTASSSVLSYSSPVKLRITYYKVTSAGNSATPNTITVSNASLT